MIVEILTPFWVGFRDFYMEYKLKRIALSKWILIGAFLTSILINRSFLYTTIKIVVNWNKILYK